MTSIAKKGRGYIVLGALSAIGEATVRRLAAEGGSFVLAGRDATRLAAVVADSQARGASGAVIWPTDLAEVSNKSAEFTKMVDALGGAVDGVLIFYGVLGDQKVAEGSDAELERILINNFNSQAAWCNAAAAVLERQRRGTLLVVSSVAGDRGRQSNYVYGAAKGAMTILMQGISHRLAASGAYAVAVKLGFVDTPMTAHIKKSGPLWAKPDDIAASLCKILRKPSSPVVYLPWFWRPIMTIIKAVPSGIFHRTKL